MPIYKSEPKTLAQLWKFSSEVHSRLPALGFIGQEPLSYLDLNAKVLRWQYWFQNLGLSKGDKIALYSTNSPAWGAVYLAVTGAGLVIVPILADFHPREVQTILVESGAKLALVGKSLEKSLGEWYRDNPSGSAVRFENLEALDSSLGERTPREEEIAWVEPVESDLAALIYTSGTTGASKGVMLTHGNICSNVVAASLIPPIDPGNEFLSVLPMAHTYECTLGFLLAIYNGCRVHYLDKPASPTALMAALEAVKPHLMLTVPLMIEKVYRNRIKPQLSSGLVKVLKTIPGLSALIYKKAGKKLMESFGGRLRFFGIGGAPLDAEVEKFLRRAGFPYSIGYGMTETSPLLAGAAPYKAPYRSTGPKVQGLSLRLGDVNPQTGVGEIQVKGPGVMLGYYNNPQATAEIFTEDGWLKTGDLGSVDAKGMVTIRGRIKTVLLGASGENIYPEAIESQINKLEFVTESLVIQRGKDLVAKVVFNYEAARDAMAGWAGGAKDDMIKHLGNLKQEINRHLNSFSRISKVEEQKEPFEKTPTLKIKRFKYF